MELTRGLVPMYRQPAEFARMKMQENIASMSLTILVGDFQPPM